MENSWEQDIAVSALIALRDTSVTQQVLVVLIYQTKYVQQETTVQLEQKVKVNALREVIVRLELPRQQIVQ